MRLLLAEDEKELSSFWSFLVISILISIVGILVVFALVLIFSKIAVKPFAESYEKRKRFITDASHEIKTPLTIIAAKSEIDDRVFGLDSGADDYVTKPFVAKELIARIRAVTRRKSETESPNLAFENITLNRSTCELSSDKASVRLANKEYQMLEMFMSNPRQIISPDRFMEKIWGFDSDTEQNVVWVYISYLRKKLAKVGANVQIKAARNMGYSLEAKND